MSRANPWTCSKMNGRRLHSTQLRHVTELTATRMYVRTYTRLEIYAPIISKWQLYVSVEYDAMSLLLRFVLPILMKISKGTYTEASDLCSVCLSCFNSFLRALGASIKKKKNMRFFKYEYQEFGRREIVKGTTYLKQFYDQGEETSGLPHNTGTINPDFLKLSHAGIWQLKSVSLADVSHRVSCNTMLTPGTQV